MAGVWPRYLQSFGMSHRGDTLRLICLTESYRHLATIFKVKRNPHARLEARKPDLYYQIKFPWQGERTPIPRGQSKYV